MIIHKNDLYRYICSEHDDVCYRVLSEMIMMNEKGIGGSFDGVKILKCLFQISETLQIKWIETDTEFGLLRSLLYLIGGVVSP